MSFFPGGPWRFEDRFGVEWTLSRPRVGEPQPGSGSPSFFATHSIVGGLVFGTFSCSGATHDRRASVLLQVYDGLTNSRLARELPQPTDDPHRILRDFDRQLRLTLLQALTDGRLRVERVPDRTWPFPDPPDEPVAALDSPAVTEQTTYFVVRVVDEVGASVDGINVVFTADGADRTMSTDGAGMARIDGIEASTASVRLGSIGAVREKLKPRWAQPRDPDILEGDGVVVRELGDDAMDTIGLQSATLATLVLTPYFQCHEVPGAHFEFGRSFVRSDALEVLAPIAEALIGDAGRKGLIFGHTDRSGPERLNKELSERRAKALHALLTQDADAWEELYSGGADGPNWHEKWDLEEIQHMLNALGVTDDAGGALAEDGINGALTTQAVRRFQSGNYPDCPAEQALLDADGDPGPETRHELFLAYAKRVSRKPVGPDRITRFGDAKFMGCGEYNPMSLTVKDAESRRAVIFVYDPAAEPKNLPCRLQSIGPCQSNCGPLPDAPDEDGRPPYRCRVYQEVAKKCPCQAGPDVSHAFRVTLLLALEQANQLPDVLVLESDDATIVQRRGASTDARASEAGLAEIDFTHLPETHSYRLRVEGVDDPYTVFEYTPYDNLSLLGSVLDGTDAGTLPDDFYVSDTDVGSADSDGSANGDEAGEADGAAPTSDGAGADPAADGDVADGGVEVSPDPLPDASAPYDGNINPSCRAPSADAPGADDANPGGGDDGGAVGEVGNPAEGALG